MPDERTCGHCREPMRGYASAGDTWLCHPDEGLDCYRMVTVYKHPMPCFQCASIHYDEPRRVRTQVERDADGVAWRQTADTRPGFATYPQTRPGDPSWWRRTASPIPVTAGQVVSQSAWVGLPPPVEGETCAKWCGYCHLTPEPAPAPPVSFADQLVERHGQPMRDALDRARVRYEADKAAAAPPRRRWWHRLTRRAL